MTHQVLDSGPALVVTPQTGTPQVSAVEQATREALARVAATGTALPPGAGDAPAPAAPAAPLPPRVPAGDPDGQGGQFTGEPRRPLPTPADPAAPAAPAPGQAAPAAPAAPEGQQPPPEGEKPAEGQAAPEGEAAPDELRVTIPGRNEGEELVLELADKDTADRVRQLANGYMRAEEAEQVYLAAEEQVQDAEAVRALAEADPVGFVAQAIGDDPAQVEHLVLTLLTEPQVWRLLSPKINQMVKDPMALREIALAQREQRSRVSATVQQTITERQAVRANVADVQTAVSAVLPADADPEVQQVFYRDMLRDLQSYAERHDLVTIPVQDIPAILAPRLAVLGLTPEAAAQSIQRATAGRLRGRGRAPAMRAATTPPAPAAPARPAVPRTGKAFVASDTRRREAAIPSAGAGSPGAPSAIVPPRKPDGSPMSSEETIAWHRSQVAKGVRLIQP